MRSFFHHLLVGYTEYLVNFVRIHHWFVQQKLSQIFARIDSQILIEILARLWYDNLWFSFLSYPNIYNTLHSLASVINFIL